MSGGPPGSARARAACLKAMALRPSNRYASARELAQEIEHWLADEPVAAYRDPVGARVGRWTRRHRAWTRAGAVSLVTVTLLAVVSALAIQASRNRVRLLLRQSEIRSADLALDRALALAHDGRVGEGMLWMNRALENAPRDATGLRRVAGAERPCLPGGGGIRAFCPSHADRLTRQSRSAGPLRRPVNHAILHHERAGLLGRNAPVFVTAEEPGHSAPATPIDSPVDPILPGHYGAR